MSAKLWEIINNLQNHFQHYIVCFPPWRLRKKTFSFTFSELRHSLPSYESNNITRPITGIGFGIGLGVLISSAYSARSKSFESASKVSLPGGMKFHLVEEE